MFYINLEISLYKAKNADRRLNIEGISSAIGLVVNFGGINFDKMDKGGYMVLLHIFGVKVKNRNYIRDYSKIKIMRGN